jgi:hypothetical protein
MTAFTRESMPWATALFAAPISRSSDIATF